MRNSSDYTFGCPSTENCAHKSCWHKEPHRYDKCCSKTGYQLVKCIRTEQTCKVLTPAIVAANDILNG